MGLTCPSRSSIRCRARTGMPSPRGGGALGLWLMHLVLSGPRLGGPDLIHPESRIAEVFVVLERPGPASGLIDWSAPVRVRAGDPFPADRLRAMPLRPSERMERFGGSPNDPSRMAGSGRALSRSGGGGGSDHPVPDAGGGCGACGIVARFRGSRRTHRARSIWKARWRDSARRNRAASRRGSGNPAVSRSIATGSDDLRLPDRS